MKTLFDEYDETPTANPKGMGELLGGRQFKQTKHEHEFQEVCSDLEKDFGKLVWTLPYKEGITEYKIQKAGEIARSRGIKKFPYLVGIIKKLP